MFGYIRPYKPELKVKTLAEYQNTYCALCDQLKKDYGFTSRYILNYDITFLVLFLNCFDQSNPIFRKVRCPYNPLKVKNVQLSETALRYGAFINYWLVTEKLLDDYTDDKNIFKSLLRKYLISKKRFKNSRQRYEEHVETLTTLLRNVYRSEQDIEDSFDFDRVTNSFGDFFADIFFIDSILFDKQPLLRKLLFQIGKWIYIVDAYDDFEKDQKKKRFNLLCSLLEKDKADKAEVFEKTLSVHLQLKQKIMNLLQDLKDVLTDECLVNIVTLGLDNVFYEITKKKYPDYFNRLTDKELDETDETDDED